MLKLALKCGSREGLPELCKQLSLLKCVSSGLTGFSSQVIFDKAVVVTLNWHILPCPIALVELFCVKGQKHYACKYFYVICKANPRLANLMRKCQLGDVIRLLEIITCELWQDNPWARQISSKVGNSRLPTTDLWWMDGLPKVMVWKNGSCNGTNSWVVSHITVSCYYQWWN